MPAMHAFVKNPQGKNLARSTAKNDLRVCLVPVQAHHHSTNSTSLQHEHTATTNCAGHVAQR